MNSSITIDFKKCFDSFHRYKNSTNPIYKHIEFLKAKHYKHKLFKRFEQDRFGPDDVLQFLSIMLLVANIKEDKWIFKPFTLITGSDNRSITAIVGPLNEIRYKTKINVKLHNAHIIIQKFNIDNDLISWYSVTSFHRDTDPMKLIIKYTIKALNELFDKWLTEE